MNAQIDNSLETYEARRNLVKGCCLAIAVATIFAVASLWLLVRCWNEYAPQTLGSIVFHEWRSDRGAGIYLMNADSTEAIRLTDYGTSPVWSPDKQRVAFASDNGIYAMSTDGADLARLTSGDELFSQPSWSPDGKRIAYVSDNDIYAIDTDGAEIVRLTDENKWFSQPSWSPDGKHIVFFGTDPLTKSFYPYSGYGIYMMDIDSADIVRLTNGFSDSWPAWSPDGKRIAYLCIDDSEPTGIFGFTGISGSIETFNICIMDTDGTDIVRLTNASSVHSRFAWSPDGKRIAYACTDRCADICMINADGTDVLRFGDAGWDFDSFDISWSNPMFSG